MAKIEDEYKLFPGCTISNRIPFIEASSRKVFDKLGIKTSDAAFACCPDPVGFNSVDHTSWLAMGARNLTLAEAEGKDIVSLCNGCFQTLKLVNVELNNNEHEKEKINKILKGVGKEFQGSINVKHFVEVLHDYGPEKIKEFITHDFSGLKVACHTGCHYNRPSEKLQTDDPMEPAPSMQMLANKFSSAVKAGADVFVVCCPACFQQMDTNQKKAGTQSNNEFKIPILYLTELYALAFGFNPDDLGLKFHRARLTGFLEKFGFK
jgi:heterodisulfide reductase subunit B